jgi:hypothetical protein
MKVHLARNCDTTPDNIKIKWRDYLAESSSRLAKHTKQLNITTSY